MPGTIRGRGSDLHDAQGLTLYMRVQRDVELRSSGVLLRYIRETFWKSALAAICTNLYTI